MNLEGLGKLTIFIISKHTNKTQNENTENRNQGFPTPAPGNQA